jgi:transcriptional regulator with XRE-family HTH domain
MNTPKTPHVHLRDLRLRLDLSQEAMAARLGLRKATYQALEYRRTASVSRRVMDAAQRLSDDPTYSYIDEYVAGRSMRQIVHQWAHDMGVARNNPREIAGAIGGAEQEVEAWLNGCRLYPSPDRFLAFVMRVDREASFRQHAEARHRKYAAHR